MHEGRLESAVDSSRSGPAGLRVEGQLLRPAVVLFGRKQMPDYPQCGLRLARFKGLDKTEFLDNRQLHGHPSASERISSPQESRKQNKEAE